MRSDEYRNLFRDQEHEIWRWRTLALSALAGWVFTLLVIAWNWVNW